MKRLIALTARWCRDPGGSIAHAQGWPTKTVRVKVRELKPDVVATAVGGVDFRRCVIRS